MKSKGAPMPHGAPENGDANINIISYMHNIGNSNKKSNAKRKIENDQYQMCHHHYKQIEHHEHSNGSTQKCHWLSIWLDSITRVLPFKQQSSFIIFIAWFFVIFITSTSLFDIVHADSSDGGAFAGSSLHVYNLGPEITTAVSK